MAREQERAVAQGVVLRRNALGREFIEIAHARVSARISVEGAHIVSCIPAGQKPLLWLSPEEPEMPGIPLRGGIPICWPWFGNERHGPAHGIARTSRWTLKDVRVTETEVHVSLGLASQDMARQLPDERWEVSVDFILGEDLQVTLVTTNTGASVQSLGQALHTYLPVSDIGQVSVLGLEGCTYRNQLTGSLEQQAGAIHIAEEVDRIYQGAVAGVHMVDPEDRISIVATGSGSTVVWNPWRNKALQLGHFPADGYRHMLCIETANAGADTRALQPGETHRLRARISRRLPG